MPYCENCGSETNPNAKFCGHCGAALTQTSTVNAAKSPVNTQLTQPPMPPKRERLSYYSPPSTPPPSAPSPTMQSTAYSAQPMQPPTAQTAPTTPPNFAQPQFNREAMIGVIPLRKPKSMGRWDTYTGVITNQRIIFAQMTSEMLKVAVQQSREQAKAQGKGFFGQWSEQLKASWDYSQRYLVMQTEAILAETPGNFFLNNSAISEIKVKLKGNDENQTRYFEVEFNSNIGKNQFVMDENSDFTDLLKRVFGDRVKMPFGYFSKSINIKL
jgi:hypothetical protein